VFLSYPFYEKSGRLPNAITGSLSYKNLLIYDHIFIPPTECSSKGNGYED
jgi:hypothetical protein